MTTWVIIYLIISVIATGFVSIASITVFGNRDDCPDYMVLPASVIAGIVGGFLWTPLFVYIIIFNIFDKKQIGKDNEWLGIYTT